MYIVLSDILEHLLICVRMYYKSALVLWLCKGHLGAMNIAHKKCEGCMKQPTFALLAEGKKHGCASCVKGHVGAVNVVHTKCEGCGEKQARHALPSDKKKWRWCGDCAPKVALSQQKPTAWVAQLGWRPTRWRTATAACHGTGPRTGGWPPGSRPSECSSGNSTAASPAWG